MTNEENKVVARRRTQVGEVSSAGGDKTIRVLLSHLVRHPRYGKYMRRHTKVAVHDPENVAKVGDTVEITTCRRMSKTKSWRLLRVVKTSTAAEAAPQQ